MARQQIELGRQSIYAQDGVDPTTASLLRGYTVAIYPSEIAVAWAYRLDWRPLPVLQSYSAYTPYLDGLDASFLRAGRAPQRILLQRSDSAIDGRVLGFDEGRTTQELICRYHSLHLTSYYAVLARNPDRCYGPEHPLVTDYAGWGQAVPVPAPPNGHALITVRISGAGVSGLETIRALFWKPALRQVLLNGVPYRLVEATAGDGLPVRTSPGLDSYPPFALVPQARTLGVERQGQTATGRPITYRFYWQSFTPR